MVTFRRNNPYKGWFCAFYIFHAAVLAVSLKVFDMERRSKLNTRKMHTNFYWVGYTCCYVFTALAFCFEDPQKDLSEVNQKNKKSSKKLKKIEKISKF